MEGGGGGGGGRGEGDRRRAGNAAGERAAEQGGVAGADEAEQGAACTGIGVSAAAAGPPFF